MSIKENLFFFFLSSSRRKLSNPFENTFGQLWPSVLPLCCFLVWALLAVRLEFNFLTIFLFALTYFFSLRCRILQSAPFGPPPPLRQHLRCEEESSPSCVLAQGLQLAQIQLGPIPFGQWAAQAERPPTRVTRLFGPLRLWPRSQSESSRWRAATARSWPW